MILHTVLTGKNSSIIFTTHPHTVPDVSTGGGGPQVNKFEQASGLPIRCHKQKGGPEVSTFKQVSDLGH